MEVFNKAKLVRLRSTMDKYLMAEDDQESVRQSRNASSPLVRWTVELVHGHSHLIRLKSAHGLYLTVTDEPMLLGVTGRKVIQAKFSARGLLDNPAVQWEPIKEGLYVKLRSKAGGRFLRGNGGAPPWRNTVTYDVPHRTATQDWILWGVDVIDTLEFDDSLVNGSASSSHLSHVSSCASDDVPSLSMNGDFGSNRGSPATSDGIGTPSKKPSSLSIHAFRRKQRSSSGEMDSPTMAARATNMFAKTFKSSNKTLGQEGSPGRATSSGTFSMRNAFKRKEQFQNQSSQEYPASPTSLRESSRSEGNLELFSNAKTVRFRSQHNKYLLAKEDSEVVYQGRKGSSESARWNVEFVEGTNMIRLCSYYGKYLTASEEPFKLGMTGKKVLQTSPEKLDSSVQWEPQREGMQVKLRTRYGNFLRANGGVPPWRNTITHDIPQRTATQDWILWDVEVLEIITKHENDVTEAEAESECESEQAVSRTNSTPSEEEDSPYSSESDSEQASSSRLEMSGSFQNEGRLVYYNVVEKDIDPSDIIEGPSFRFKGKGLEELKEMLGKKTGIKGFSLCSRNALNGKLYPIKLQLPPNNTSMHVFLVPEEASEC